MDGLEIAKKMDSGNGRAGDPEKMDSKMDGLETPKKMDSKMDGPEMLRRCPENWTVPFANRREKRTQCEN